MGEIGRRELQTRKKQWPKTLASWLARAGVTPNMVSIASMVFGATTFLCWIPLWEAETTTRVILLMLGTISIQLRLLCNLVDGLIAVEGGMKSAVGDLYNDVPDRFSDVAVLVAAGYLTTAPELGWLAAVVAVGTAYIRTLGTALTGFSDYTGPMAKQHRMFLMTLAGLGASVELFVGTHWVMTVALSVVILGSFVTIFRRLKGVATKLRSNS